MFSWFGNMKTIWKLMLGFALVGGIMAFVGYTGLTNMGRINESTENIYNVQLKPLMTLTKARGMVHQMRAATLTAVLTQNAADREEALAKVKDLNKQVDENKEGFIKTIKGEAAPSRRSIMDLKTFLWYGVLLSITGAYLVALAGARSARHHDVAYHSRLMIRACTIVGLWLVAYVTKQLLFGRERFGGTQAQYWALYVPVFSAHMLLAVTTIGVGAYNLYQGLTRLRYGSVGAMAAGMTLHRRLGKLLVWTFSGTMATAYLVYLMLFVWYPGS